MNTEQKRLCQELTLLMRYNTFEKVSYPCRGKWRGTTDYFLLFDKKTTLFISNGMKYFYDVVKSNIDFLKQFKENKAYMFRLIQEQVTLDNEIAKQEGLQLVTVKDIGVNTSIDSYSLWTYLVLEVDNKIFQFVESGLNFFVMKNRLEEYLITNREKSIFTAGAVQIPTFIFANVRYSHLDNLYKLNNANK